VLEAFGLKIRYRPNLPSIRMVSRWLSVANNVRELRPKTSDSEKITLDIAVAQGEAEIKPDRMLNDLGREAMAVVTERSHAEILPDTPMASDPVSVTMPIRMMIRIVPSIPPRL
jgi:hypothetical protein